MALSKEEILDAVAGMTVLELSELIKMMEEKFGVSAAAAAVAVAAPAAGGAAGGAAAEEQTEFTVVLAAAGEKKVEVIKVVELDPAASVSRVLMLVKVKADASTRGQVLEVVQLFRAKVIDVAADAVTMQITGNTGKIADFLSVLEPFGIRELVQSGQVAISRGSRSISERTLRPVAVPVPPANVG